MEKEVSVVVRTYNEARHIGRLIETLRSQIKYGNNLEIIVVDNGSTDSTVDIVRKHNVSVINISRDDFNYSKALNVGIEKTCGELIIIISAHAIPFGNDWLLKIVRHFEEQDVAGVYCRQMPWPDADATEVLRIERTFGTESKTFGASVSDESMHFSNAASCIRGSVWKKHRFVVLPASEDAEWALWAIDNGYSIVYEAGAVVYHSHNESYRSTAKRVIELEKAADFRLSRKRNFLLITKQAAGWFVRDLAQVFSSQHFKGKRIKYFARSLACCFWYVADFNRNNQDI